MAGKNYKGDRQKVDSEKFYSLGIALEMLEGFAKRKFDESVDVAIRLGIDPKQSDQSVRGAVTLPNGIGKKVRVAVFAKGEKIKEAEEVDADVVGGEELAKKVEGGWLEFDKVIATPDMMGIVGRLGKVLGPRGLMPNPKLGTVTADVAKAVVEAKSGRVEFRIDKGAVVHAPVGRRSFGREKLEQNIRTLLDAVQKAKPPTAKGTYIQGISISATMTPGIRVNLENLVETV